MHWPMKRVGLLALGAFFLTACASTPERVESPGVEPEGAMDVELEAGLPVERPAGLAQAARDHGLIELEVVGQPPYTEADVHFMQMMIVHHEQALEMAEMAPERSARDDVKLLAERIRMAQADEIAFMQHWLRARGHEAPGVDRTGLDPDHAAHHDHAAHQDHAAHRDHAAHHDDHADMPGMLSPEQLEALAAASGEAFDRMFLEFMIFHHEGALVMVHELFEAPGAGQEGMIAPLAMHIESDQTIEIERMRRMLERGGS